MAVTPEQVAEKQDQMERAAAMQIMDMLRAISFNAWVYADRWPLELQRHVKQECLRIAATMPDEPGKENKV